MKKLLLAGISAIAFAAAPAAAQNNMSSVDQTGSGAIATVTQDGANDRSTVTQTSGGTVTVQQTGVQGSTSTVTTGADDRPPESTVTIRQTDTGGAVAGTSEANVSTVIQDNVNGFGETGTGSTVSVTQHHNIAGTEQNSSYVQQGRNAVSGQVSVSQVGGDNSSYYSSFTSFDNDADIDQSGEGNNSTVLQNFQARGAYASVSQHGTGGGDNDAFIEQVSDGYAAVPAEFARGADAIISQNGSGNSSSISQTGYSELMSQGNYALNVQTGDDDISSIDQGGIDNEALVHQSGTGNWSMVDQGGNNNSAHVTQTTDGNMSSVIQSGSGNSATVTQGM